MNVVHPGSTQTDAIAAVQAERAKAEGISKEEFESRAAQRVAIRRIIKPEELAYVVAFLCSPKAECVTGESIAAGGGALGAVFY